MKEFYIVDRGEKINIIHDELNNPDCILIHLHGLNSHFQFIYYCQNEFKYRIKYLQKANISSYALEFLGHGKSGGIKGYIDNFDKIITNVLSLLTYIEFKHPNKPIFILGESMGAAIGIKIGILSKKIKGVILLAPMCGLYKDKQPSKIKLNIALILSNYFPKWKLIGTNKDVELCCKNKIYNDNRKLCKYEYTGKIMLSTARECYKLINWNNENKKYFDKSILAIHSYKDFVTSIEQTKLFIDSCNSNDKELLQLDEGFHKLLIPNSKEDPIPDSILSKITNWINNRII
jgi:alpha-beta hydrolase superfamily lysophospholipase